MSSLDTAGYISGLLSILVVIPYIWEIFRHQVKPERATWLVWTILTAISYFSQRSAGAGASLWFTLGNGVGVALVLVISLFKGVGGLTRFDLMVLALAGLGIAGWLTFDSPGLAIASVIFADLMGTLPTLRKAYRDPASESVSAFTIATLSAVLGIYAVGAWSAVLVAYPLYILLADGAIVVAVLAGRRSVQR